MSLSSIFLVSSFPSLRWLEKPIVSSDEILLRIKPHVSDSEFSVFECIKKNRWTEIQLAFANDWIRSERQLIAELAMERKRRFGSETTSPISSKKHIQQIFSQNNPLEREMAADFIRWNRAVALSQSDAQGFLALVAYFIKLLLLEKYARLDLQKGKQAMVKSTNLVLESSAQELQKIR